MRLVIGLGANLGDRRAALGRAVSKLEEVGRVVARSAVYETAPVDAPPPSYLNAAVLIETELDPEALMRRLLAIEAEMGRVRKERNEPRVIDLDILWIEGRIVESATLVVPHPRLRERAFALAPLLDVMPAAVEPKTGARYADTPVDRSELVPVDHL